MSSILDSQALNLIMSSLSLMISSALLIIHIRNRKTQIHSYFLARAAHRSSGIDLKYVSSEQVEEKVLIKLVLFNPGSIASIIQSLTVYKKAKRKFFILELFGIERWESLRAAKWWPISDASCKEQQYFADEYKSLYVEDQRDIYVLIPGYIDRGTYKFIIKTNKGEYAHATTIDGINGQFPYHFEQWFQEQ